ncbi:hypothetical protein JXJ21_00335 [candidate division KSB1 bacterium]|nr:hypothetical protein [candidate division KSB1 bacterium]
MELTQIVSWIGFTSGLFIGIPQIMKTVKKKSVRDVSALTFLLVELTSVCLLIRAIAIEELAFISYYIFKILSTSFLLFLIWRYRVVETEPK